MVHDLRKNGLERIVGTRADFEMMHVVKPTCSHLKPTARGDDVPWSELIKNTHFEWCTHARRQRRPYHGGSFEHALAHHMQRSREAAMRPKADMLHKLVREYAASGNIANEIALLEPMFAEAAPSYSIHGIDLTCRYGNRLSEFLSDIGVPNPSLRQTSFTCWHLLQHYNHGKRVYQVEKPLGEALAETNLKGLVGSDLKLPFPSIYIQPPDLDAPLKVYNVESGWHRVVGIYVAHDQWIYESGYKQWRKLKQDPDYVADVRQGRDFEECLTFYVVGEDKGMRGFADMADDAIFWFRMPLMDTDMASCLLKGWKPGPDEHADGYVETLRLVEWVANIIMYVTCTSPGTLTATDKSWRHLKERIGKLPAKSAKRARLVKQLRDYDPRSRIVLKSDKITVDRARAEAEAGNTGTGRKQTVRCKVAGHYRTYRVGQGRTGRRHRWIEPFWRGPELGELVAKRHLVK